MINNTTFYTLLLSLLPGIGPGRIWAWQEIYGTPEKILLADPDTLPKITYNAKVSLRQFHSQGEMSPLACKGYQVLESLERQQATLLTAFDPDYSGLLKKIYRPPPLLFAKGNIQLLSLPQIAIIGTRNPTRSGLENTRLFGKYLAKGGFAITSGLALGIDGAA
ncbi:MAG: DNA-processing protein DprA, partial [Pseudomonadota bacterium]